MELETIYDVLTEDHILTKSFLDTIHKTFPNTIINDKYVEALKEIEEGKNVLISGAGGVGKSRFVEMLKYFLTDYIVLGPTGVSAINIGGQTIHSFFKFKPRLLTIQDLNVDWYDKKLFENIKYIIIDEISMVRSDIFQSIDFVLSNVLDGENFGDIQMILIGDLLQLPPIMVSDDERNYLKNVYGGYYFFNTPAFLSGNFKCINFDIVYRQNDREFIKNLNSIRNYSNIHDAVDYFNEKVMNESEFEQKIGSDYIYLTTTNKNKDKINQIFLDSIEEIEKEYEANILINKDNAFKYMPVDHVFRVKKGSQVMFVRNDGDKRWVNGTIGKVVGFSDDEEEEKYNPEDIEYIIVEAHGCKYRVQRTKFEMVKFVYDSKTNKIEHVKVCEIEQFPLILAWALTIHKSQSATFEKVYLDLGWGSFAEGQTYVALSRCVSYDNLGLKRKIKPSDVKVNIDMLKFYNENFIDNR